MALGPSLFGQIAPSAWRWLFPDDDRQAGLLLGLAWFGIVLLLMSTGAETDIAVIRRHGRVAMSTAVGSLVVPLGAGVLLGLALPDSFIGLDGRRSVFAAFVGIALAISSLPVAARILSDLGLLHRPMGQLVLTVAMSNDVIGWILLGLLAGVAETGAVSVGSLALSVGGMAVISLLVLVWGGRSLDRTLAVIRDHDGGPAAAASVAVLFTVAVGAMTQAVGLEVVIGAFLAGIAIGRSRFVDEPVMHHLEVATAGVFAPLFFAVAGLRVDLRALDERGVLLGVVLITVVATVGKMSGAYAGARISGLPHADAFGASAALNARGALEVVVATVGLTTGVLSDASYTGIVVMAIVTSAMAAPLLKWGADARA